MTKSIYSSDYKAFIDALIQERKRLGLSQSEVANLLEMTQSDISKIEGCDRRIDVMELKKLLEAYRVKTNHKLTVLTKNFFELG